MPILVQLYSSRNVLSQTEALDRIAAAGYDGVEGCWLNFEDPVAFRKELDLRGLTMPQAHVPMEMLENEFDRVTDLTKHLGIYTVIAPWLPEDRRPSSTDGWRNLGERLDLIEGKLRALGLRFAWHNHDFELISLPDGRTPIDILLETAPGMDWEVDVGWILRAGQDPVRWLTSYAGRIVAVHLKDIRPDTLEEGWADLGFGESDWSDVFRTLRALPRLAAHVAEHDAPLDFSRFVSRWKIAHDRLSVLRRDRSFEGFTHVALKVHDLDAQLSFYERVMGFREMFRLPNEDGSVFLVYLRINDRQYLELFPGAIGEHAPNPAARGYQHICLEVADVDATVETLRARGARMCLWRNDLSGIYEVNGTAITMGRDGNRQSWIKDPEGNRIELMELNLAGMQYGAMAARLSSSVR
ncbi:VOC family protein [Ensifer sp. R-19]|uniref:VOC family protein n=1 Tax=Ensifer sp. R-19 TaxID=3404055 RepID=UPI003CEE1265